MAEYLIPGLLAVLALISLHKKANAYDLLTEGAVEGFHLLGKMIPTLVILMSAVSMLRAAGILEFLQRHLAPFFRMFGIPPETVPLVLVRPFSGSAALAVGAQLMQQYGPDSRIGRTAAVMLGSTETTFYTISIYLGSNGIKNSRYTVAAALCADFVGFWAASWTVRLFYP